MRCPFCESESLIHDHDEYYEEVFQGNDELKHEWWYCRVCSRHIDILKHSKVKISKEEFDKIMEKYK